MVETGSRQLNTVGGQRGVPCTMTLGIVSQLRGRGRRETSRLRIDASLLPESWDTIVRILDLDLDYFLDRIAYGGAESGRLSSEEYAAWSPESVAAFLEDQCGLSTLCKIPGRVVSHHDGAFWFWKQLIGAGSLSCPFDVVHVDAHADLGLGDAGYLYLMTSVLALPPEERDMPLSGPKGINAGNYLSFAIACRWISSLTYVVHPASRNDLMPYHFHGFDPQSGMLELKHCAVQNLLRFGSELSYEAMGVIATEPLVPFTLVRKADFTPGRKYDFVLLSLSPGFTPKESDDLVPIIEAYIDAI